MIIDWINTCNEIHQTHKLFRDEKEDNKIWHKQEIMYIVFLKELGYTFEQCYNEWVTLVNGSAINIINDKDESMNIFKSLWDISSRKKYDYNKNFKQINPISIYKEEIDFLNALDAPKWVKEYWCCLLIYYKFSKQINKKVEKTKTLNCWAIRHTSKKDKNYGGDCQDKIAQIKIQNKFNIIADYICTTKNETKTYYAMQFEVEAGTQPIILQDFSSIDCVLNEIRDNKKECQACGEYFLSTSKTKRNICLSCYKKKRIKRISKFYYGCENT